MTYLELVNKVLVRLRESTVTTVNENAYSSLVGEFVNDAKDFVENAWDWSALRSTTIVTTSAFDLGNYTLSNVNQASEIKSVLNDTSNAFMKQQSKDWFDKQTYFNDPVVYGSPAYYQFNGVLANGSAILKVYPRPDGVYNLVVNSVSRTDDLESDNSSVILPTKPIIHLATAFAARERGETGGTSAQELFAIADKSLSDAIAIDANRHPEELVYVAV